MNAKGYRHPSPTDDVFPVEAEPFDSRTSCGRDANQL